MKNSGSDLASFRVVVRGRVQGVYFRVFVRRHAMALGLAGYARNLPQTRSVEVAAEGERPQLEELLKYVYRGPVDARVENVEVQWGPFSGEFSSFRIRY